MIIRPGASLFLFRLLLFSAVAALWRCSPCSAVTILSGPFFTNAPSAPLAGTLQLTTDVPSRVSISVSDGFGTWGRDYYDYSTAHTVTLLGFKPNRTNLITVAVRDKFRNAVTATNTVKFITAPLPAIFPPMVLITNQPARMEPGYTLFRGQKNGGSAAIIIVDQDGQVVWYSTISSTDDVRQLANGDLFIPLLVNFIEVNMLGQIVKTWTAPAGYPINSHDGVPTPHGTILYLSDASRVVTNFPTSATNSSAPLQTTNVLYNRVVEISMTNSALLNVWSPIDFLDPTRLTYLTFDSRTTQGWDIEHSNAVIEDPRDNSLIVSMRNQNVVVKFSRDGRLKWLLGPHENWGPQFQPYLLTPVGEPFAWHYGQHAPTLTPQGTLLLYDNGNYRATPYAPIVLDVNNYSRAVEYSINEDSMEVTQVWDFGRTNEDVRLFTDRLGNAEPEPQTGNVLLDCGYVIYVDGVRPSPTAPSATMLRLREVTHDPVPEVVFDLALFDYSNTSSSYKGFYAYRCHRIPDLYSILPQPVADLRVLNDQGFPHLEFSGNPVRTYVIQTSTDLVQWTDIATAVPGTGGDYDFTDTESGTDANRYYRVATR